MEEAEIIWRDAVGDAQSEIASLSADYNRLASAYESMESQAGLLDSSTVNVDATIEEQAFRGQQLKDITARGVGDVRQALIDATNRLDDLRRVVGDYHHM